MSFGEGNLHDRLEAAERRADMYRRQLGGTQAKLRREQQRVKDLEEFIRNLWGDYCWATDDLEDGDQTKTRLVGKMRKLRWEGYPANGRFSISKRWRYLVDSPFEFSEQCCDVMKKRPFHRFEREGLKPMIATMAEESRLRFQEYLQHGCNSFDAKRVKSTPLGFWTEQDVLGYLHERGIEYARCYGEVREENGKLYNTGVKRTGCMFCLFGIYAEHEPNRMQRMQRDYPKQYDYCINKLGIGKVLDYVGVPYKYQPTLFDKEITV